MLDPDEHLPQGSYTIKPVLPVSDGEAKAKKRDGHDQGTNAILPVIRVSPGELPRIVDEAENALIASDQPIFRRSGKLVRPAIESVPAAKDGVTVSTCLRPMCVSSMIDALALAAIFQQYNERKKRWTSCNPPKLAAEILLVREGKWRLPPVAGIITTPTLRPDGSLLTRPGYDPATRLYLALADKFQLPQIPDKPSRDEALVALQLLDALLSGFPFVGPVDRAVALSGIITAVVRGALQVAPLHAIRAHTAGTGKSHLVDVVAAIATGRRCPVITASDKPEETEKRLAAMLRSAQPIVSLDNVNGELGGDLLCQMTERPLVQVRILGLSETPEFENRSTMFATGNNLVLVGDMTRRTVLCTLDAAVERPELREFDFDPVERVLADRGAYVAAVLTIVRAYLAAGAPRVCGPIGSYDDWSASVRAPLIWLGQADPTESMKTARAEDPDLSGIRELHAHWRERLAQASSYTIGQIIEAACEQTADGGEYLSPEFRDLLLRIAGQGGKISNQKLGAWLSQKASGRVIDGYRIEKQENKKNGNGYALCLSRGGL